MTRWQRSSKQSAASIAEAEAKKARLALATDLEQKDRQVADLQQNPDRQQYQARRSAEGPGRRHAQSSANWTMPAANSISTVEKKVQESLAAVRDKAKLEAEESLKGQGYRKRKLQIAGMQRQIEELRRKAEQGSQQLQGEALELELESLLRGRFPRDLIEPVPKGEFGGDVLHRVLGPSGQPCGTILWESKRTKNWSDGWLAKLRDDQRSAKAEIALIVSSALPKGVETFDLIDGVWVAETRFAIPARDRAAPIADRSRNQPSGTGGPADQDGARLPVPDRSALPPPHRCDRREVHGYAGRPRPRTQDR